MEAVRKCPVAQRPGCLALSVRVAVMNGSVCRPCVASVNLHDVDFPAPRPLSVDVFIGSHEPECRKETFSLGNFQAGFKNTVGKILFVLRTDPSRRVMDFAVYRAFNRTDNQIPVFKKNVFFRIHIFLQFCIHPSRFMKLHIPVVPV